MKFRRCVFAISFGVACTEEESSSSFPDIIEPLEFCTGTVSKEDLLRTLLERMEETPEESNVVIVAHKNICKSVFQTAVL